MAHFVKDIRAIPSDVIAVFYGHTHRWNFKKLDDHYFINPGHLKNYSDRGRDASYLMMEVNQDKLNFEFYNYDHKMFLSRTIYK
jgi:predicted phosphodiesterase